MQDVILTAQPVSSGYGFVDFDSPAAAQKAVTALKSTGIQAQMAKVRIHCGTILISRYATYVKFSMLYIIIIIILYAELFKLKKYRIVFVICRIQADVDLILCL